MRCTGTRLLPPGGQHCGACGANNTSYASLCPLVLTAAADHCAAAQRGSYIHRRACGAFLEAAEPCRRSRRAELQERAGTARTRALLACMAPGAVSCQRVWRGQPCYPMGSESQQSLLCPELIFHIYQEIYQIVHRATPVTRYIPGMLSCIYRFLQVQ